MCIKTRSPPASLLLKVVVTEHTTVKRAISNNSSVSFPGLSAQLKRGLPRGGLMSLRRSFTTLPPAKKTKIKSELSLSQTVALFPPISVGCWCFGKRCRLFSEPCRLPLLPLRRTLKRTNDMYDAAAGNN